MSLTPWPSQLADLSRLRDANYTGLLAMEPGAGKTHVACLCLKEVEPNVALIIAPNSTIDNPKAAWPKTVLDVCGREVRVIGNGTKREREARHDFEFGYEGIYATTPQLFTRKTTNINTWTGDFLISDESHGLTTAKKSGQKKWSGYEVSDDPLNLRFTHRLALSGTPMRQDFANMWATMRFLWPELNQRDQVAYHNYYMWMQDRMTSKQVYTSNKDRDGNYKKVTQYLAETIPGKLVTEAPLAIVHRRREYCCEFHPNGFMETEAPNVIEVEVELTVKQKKAIHELETHMMTYLEENPLITDLSMIQKMRVKQLCLGEALSESYLGTSKDGEAIEKTRIEFAPDCKSPFADAMFDILDDLPRDEPVLILLESQRFASVLVQKLVKRGISAEEYSGKTKADLYQLGDDYRVLVAVMSAMREGTDGLQDNCNTEIYLETPGSLTSQEQVFARLDRPGGKRVQRYIIHDTLGYSRGRYSALLEKQLHVNASLRREE